MARSVPIRLAEAAIKQYGEKLRKAAGLALYSAAIRGVGVIQTQIIPSIVPKPVDRGLYRAGWRAVPILGVGGDVAGAEIFNVEPHAPWIEGGVRASNVKVGRAMIDALTEWVKRKGLAGRGKRYKGDAAARGIAFAIALKMKKQGIFRGGQGMHVLGTLMKGRMPSIVQAEIARAAKAMK